MALQIDPTIVLLVQKYLENNKDKTFVDISQMAEDIQRQHREYAYRKRSTFRSEVKDAYHVVLKSYTKGKTDSSDEDLVSDGSDDDSDKSAYGVNSIRHHLKNSATMNPTARMVESVLIDISSEDSDEEAAQNAKQSNGAVTNPAQFKPNVALGQLSNNNKVSTINVTQERAKKRKSETMSSLNEGMSKIKRRYRESDNANDELIPVTCSFDNIGGYNGVIDEIGKSLVHINSGELGAHMPQINGILLYGPRGSGKTLLVNAIAIELNFNLYQISIKELLSAPPKQNEDRIREVFDKTGNLPGCILCIDKLDLLGRKRGDDNERINSLTSSIIKGFQFINGLSIKNKIIIIGLATDPNDVPPSLRRADLFVTQIGLNVPTENDREEILTILTKAMKMEKDLSLNYIAKKTRGFVGADLKLLVTNAYLKAVDRLLVLKIPEPNSNNIENIQIIQNDPIDKTDKIEENNKSEESTSGPLNEPNVIVDDENMDEKKEANLNSSGDAVLVLDDAEEPQKIENVTASTSGYDNQTNGEIIVDNINVENTEIEVATTPNQQINLDTRSQKAKRWDNIKHLLNSDLVKNVCIQTEDFLEALKSTCLAIEDQNNFIITPNVSFEDIGSLKNIKEELITEISLRVKYAEKFTENGLKISNHILLCGPPGCGKTMLINGLANEININFLWQKSYVLQRTSPSEKERAIKECFTRARSFTPCILFLSDLERFCPLKNEREDHRVLDQILTEIDKIKPEEGIFVMASTNDPNLVDSQILTRFGKIIYVGLPSREARVDILRTITKNGTKPKLDDDLDLVSLGTSEQLKGYTGHDLVRLVNRAYNLAIKELINIEVPKIVTITKKHFINAIDKMMPSIGENDQKKYDIMKRVYSSGPDSGETEEMEYS